MNVTFSIPSPHCISIPALLNDGEGQPHLTSQNARYSDDSLGILLINSMGYIKFTTKYLDRRL